MFKNHTASLGFLLIFMVSACSAAPTSPMTALANPSAMPESSAIPSLTTVAPEPSPTTDLLAENARKVAAIFEQAGKPDEPGGVVIVLEDGKTLLKAAYGLANIETKAPLTPQNMFHIGSVSKQFTAMGLMMLAKEGKLAYDDPIGKYLPELAHFGDEVTIRCLLNHTSGLPQPSQEQLLARAKRPDNKDELALLASTSQLGSEPGTQYEYSDTGYEMLASLIERLSGKTYAQFLEERIFAPLGMTHTFSLPNPDRLSDPAMILSYVHHPGEPILAVPPDIDPLDHLVGSGSVYSTVDDLALYDAALYTDQLVSQAALDEGMKPGKLKDGAEVPYGFGWELGQLRGERFVRHSGRALAFHSNYLRFPERHLSVIVLLNRTYPPMDSELLADAIATVYLNNNPLGK